MQLRRTGKTVSLFLDPETIRDAAERLFAHDFFLEDITGVDSSDGLMAVYHFDHFVEPGRVCLYVVIPREAGIIPSISDIYKGAAWHERETSDFFGIAFGGHPDPSPLLLPEDMHSHPLLKEEEARLPINDLLVPGEILDRNPDFAFFVEQKAPEPDKTE